MLAKLSVDQALMKAKSHVKKGNLTEAKMFADDDVKFDGVRVTAGLKHNYGEHRLWHNELALVCAKSVIRPVVCTSFDAVSGPFKDHTR